MELPSYEHFAAYWMMTDKTYDETKHQLQMTLTERLIPTTAGDSSPADLAGNDTVQTELPQVKSLAAEILRQAPKDRRLQASLILKFLKEHYTYDYNMAKAGLVRPGHFHGCGAGLGNSYKDYHRLSFGAERLRHACLGGGLFRKGPMASDRTPARRRSHRDSHSILFSVNPRDLF